MANPTEVALRAKRWNEKNPEKFKKAREEWAKTHPFHRQKKTYGVDREMYEALLIEQKFCCAICGKHQSEFKNRLGIDHCHVTLKVRGLLCSSCNLIIGHASDECEILEKAILYLKKSC